MSQLTWAERMDRFLRGTDRGATDHEKFNYAGQRLSWEPPANRPDLRAHRGMTARWKSGPPGVLVVCLDCPIRTRARRGAEDVDLIRRDVRTWRFRHDRVVKAQETIINQLVEGKVEHEKRREHLQDVLNVQGSRGNWDADPYMLGLFNGLEMARSLWDGDQPNFRAKPEEGWVYERAKGSAADLVGETTVELPRDPVDRVVLEDAQEAGRGK